MARPSIDVYGTSSYSFNTLRTHLPPTHAISKSSARSGEEEKNTKIRSLCNPLPSIARSKSSMLSSKYDVRFVDHGIYTNNVFSVSRAGSNVSFLHAMVAIIAKTIMPYLSIPADENIDIPLSTLFISRRSHIFCNIRKIYFLTRHNHPITIYIFNKYSFPPPFQLPYRFIR